MNLGVKVHQCVIFAISEGGDCRLNIVMLASFQDANMLIAWKVIVRRNARV